MSHKLLKLLLAMSSILAVTPATAATIVDTGVADPAKGGFALTTGQYLAAEFDLASDDTIDTIEAYIGGIVSQNITIRIFSDGGDVPGSVLFEASFVSAITEQGDAEWQGMSGLGWTLDAGTYWVGFEGDAAPYAYYGYIQGYAPNPLGNEANGPFFSYDGQAFHGDDYLDLSIRITDNIDPSVPEPATWASMLIGFAVIGGTMRARRRQRPGLRLRFA